MFVKIVEYIGFCVCTVGPSYYGPRKIVTLAFSPGNLCSKQYLYRTLHGIPGIYMYTQQLGRGSTGWCVEGVSRNQAGSLSASTRCCAEV